MDMSGRTNPELQRLRAEALAGGRRAEADAIAAEIASRERRYRTGEMLDIYDDSLRPLGVKERGLVHLDGDWHRSFHCWLCSPRRRTLLVQRRSLTKATYPGALDTTVAGHYRAGEGLADVCREGEEELGLALEPDRLIGLGRAVDAARHGVLIDREVSDVFLYLTDVPLQALRPDPAEVAEVLEFDVEAALALFRGEAGDAPASARGAGAHTAARPVRIRRDEFTVFLDGRYHARLALQAQRALDGLPPLWV
jgi:isopentenyldiphosphate isomerase